METEPSTNGDNRLPAEARDAKGRFLRGNPGGPGNPQAHNVAAWRKALADAVSPDDVAEVTRKVIEAAKAGEPWAIHELFDRLLGKPSVQIDFEATDMAAIPKYDERLAVEAQRITRFLLLNPPEEA